MENPGITPEKREEAAKTLREILDRMGIDAEVSAFEDGDRIILDAHGAESGLIIGKKGATLDALQYVINRIISKKPSDGPGVIVDAEGYRGRREDSLADLARRRLPVAGYLLSRTDSEAGPHESGNAELIATITGRRPLGIVPHVPPEARDDDDRAADAVEAAIGEDGLRALFG